MILYKDGNIDRSNFEHEIFANEIMLKTGVATDVDVVEHNTHQRSAKRKTGVIR